GVLTGALDTALVDGNGHTKAGIEWFVVRPNGEDGARLVSQGYFGVTNNNVNYPAITMNANGQGVMAFTLVGNNHYPSAAFTSFSASGTGRLQVAAEGGGPSNGFRSERQRAGRDGLHPRRKQPLSERGVHLVQCLGHRPAAGRGRRGRPVERLQI